MAETELEPAIDEDRSDDEVVTATKHIPWLIPLSGAVMIFCLALVAVFLGAP